MARAAARGDIYHVDLDPTKGKEQRGKRFIYVLSPAEHNKRGLLIALPISQGQTLARSTGYACTLTGSGTRTQGVIICDQPRTLDFSVRDARYVETVPDYITDDVLGRLVPLVT